MAGTNDAEEAKYSSYFYKPYAFTKSHPIYKRVCLKEIKRLCKKAKIEQIINLCNEFSKVNPITLSDIAQQWYAALFTIGDMKKGYEAIVASTLIVKNWYDADNYIGWNINDKQIELIYKKKLIYYLIYTLKNIEKNYGMFINNKNLIKNKTLSMKRFLRSYKNMNYDKAINNYKKFDNGYISLQWMMAEIYIKNKQYVKAFKIIKKSIIFRQYLMEQLLYEAPINIKLTKREKAIIISCKQYLNPEQIKWIKQFNLY